MALETGLHPLSHPTRRLIYEHLLQMPGNHFRGIARSLGLAVGTASHYLAVLLRDGFLTRMTSNGRTRYYPAADDGAQAKNRLFMKHWKYRDLRIRALYAVAFLPHARTGTVAGRLGISRQLASYHLARLEELGWIDRSEGGWRARPVALDALARSEEP